MNWLAYIPAVIEVSIAAYLLSPIVSAILLVALSA